MKFIFVSSVSEIEYGIGNVRVGVRWGFGTRGRGGCRRRRPGKEGEEIENPAVEATCSRRQRPSIPHSLNLSRHSLCVPNNYYNNSNTKKSSRREDHQSMKKLGGQVDL